jgi:hypothetical protein
VLSALAGSFFLTVSWMWAQTATTTTLTITPATPIFGQTVTFTAQVAPSAAQGSVSFVDQGMLVGVGTLNASGVATASTITLAAGNHSIRALYGGSATYQASQSAATTYTVTAVAGTGFKPQLNYAVGADAPLTFDAVGDFNGDGKADLVVLQYGSPGTLSILLGNGAGSFQPAVNYPVTANPTSVVIGDFNGDGKPDLAVASFGPSGPVEGVLSILLGNGDGTFQPAVTYSTGGYTPESIAMGDFNGDGKADLVVANYGSAAAGNLGNVSVLLGNGDGTFQSAVSYDGGGSPAFVAVADFNGDGKADLAVGQSGGVGIFLGNGDGTFLANGLYVAGANPSSIAIGDFNLDGKLDLAVGEANILTNDAYVLLGKGDGSFETAVPLTTGADPYSVVVGDFNGDGKPDIATANNQSNNVSVLIGNGDGTFQPAVNYPAGDDPNCIVVADFNGDGVADLASSNFIIEGVTLLIGIGPSGPVGVATTTTLLATPNPSQYQLPVTLTATVTPSGVAGQVEFLDDGNVIGVGSLNDSGVAQIVTSALNSGTGSLYAQYLGQPGVWQPSISGAVSQTVTALAGSGFAAATSYSVGISPNSVATGDFNGDGKIDLAVTNGTSNDVSVMLGNGDGTYQTAVNYATGAGPQYVVVGDFNGDGIPDLATANSDGSVSLLLGNGDGTFKAAISYQTGTRLAYLAADDYNADGKLDLAIPYWTNVGVFVALGNGDGTFQAPLNTQIYVTEGTQPIAAADFNGDGKADLAVATTNNAVSILLGNGDGTFQAPVNYPVPNSWSVAIGDFNGDGYPDLAVSSNVEPTTISILLGNGDGTFKSPVSTVETFAAFYMTVADFNGDGKSDMAVIDGTQVDLLLGNGDGTFQAPRTYPVGNFPIAAAAADFNGDGRIDLAVANESSGNVSVLLALTNQNSFNGDGQPDIIWEDPVSGWAQIWYLGGAQGVSLLGAADLTEANPWHIVGIGDFNGDGHPDVVWQDPVSGAVQVWYMGGAGGNTLLGAADITTKNPWQVLSVADFNRDGHPDLLWQDPKSGWAQIWYMGGLQGTTLLGAADLTTANPWHLVGSADFNGDGFPDVLWQDPVSGTVQIWYLGGTTPGSQGSVFQSAVNLTGPMTTKVVAIADFNLDGHPDVIFQDATTGAATAYFYTGALGTTPAGTAVVSAGNPWYIAGPH